MAFITYRDKKIIPAPFISVQKEYVKSSGGTTIINHPSTASTRQGNIIGSFFNIEITGTIIASMMGSPQIDGNLWGEPGYPDGEQSIPKAEDGLEGSELDKKRFNRILKMQQSLRWLFAKDGYYLEIDDGFGNLIFKCIVREVSSVNFQEAARGENWTDRCEYTISLIADRIESSGHPLCPLGEDDVNTSGADNLPKDTAGNDIYLEEASENWSVEAQEEGSDEDSPYTFAVNHTINAKGKRVYSGAGLVSSEAWEEAEKWVKTKLMKTSSTTQSITSDQQGVVINGTTGLNLSGYSPYNRIRSESVDEMEGTYSVTENFLLAKDKSIETYNVSVRSSQQTGLTTLSIDGNVRGLDDNIDQNIYNKTSNQKYTNALAKYNTINQLTRATAISSVGLNPSPLSTNVSHNEIEGSISYSSEYNNRPTSCISGARSESINVQFSGGVDVFARIPVVGRAEGPIMQDMNTITEKKVAISIEAIMAVKTYSAALDCDDLVDAVCDKPSTDSLIGALRDEAIGCHPGGGGTDTFKESDSESFNVNSGRYTRSVTYILKTC